MANPIVVSGKDGWCGIVHSWWGGSPDDTQESHQITIRLDSGETVVIPDSILSGRPDGSYYVPFSLEDVRAGNFAASASEASSDSPTFVIPVIHEELHVGKRTVETGGGVRVEKSVREEEQTVDLPLIHEQVEVERVPMDKLLDGPVPVRYIGDTIVVPVIEEVVVLQKQLRLVEELHIRKKRTETRQPQKVVLRKEEARVERLEEAAATREGNEGLPRAAGEVRPADTQWISEPAKAAGPVEADPGARLRETPGVTHVKSEEAQSGTDDLRAL